MTTSYKTKLDYSLVKIYPAVKDSQTGNYTCNIKYNNAALVFSTPRLNIKDEKVFFKPKTKKNFLDFLSDVDGMIISNLTQNSEIIFKGKKFTEERFKNSLQPTIEIYDENSVSLEATIDKNVSCFDVFGEPTELSNLSKFASALVKINSITFSKDLYKINYVITSLKSSRFDNVGFSFDEDSQEIEKKIPEKSEINTDCDNFFE